MMCPVVVASEMSGSDGQGQEDSTPRLALLLAVSFTHMKPVKLKGADKRQMSPDIVVFTTEFRKQALRLEAPSGCVTF